MEDPLAIDQVKTKDRAGIIELYGSLNIIPGFGSTSNPCRYLTYCSESAKTDTLQTGTWPYVGIEYGNARVNGQPKKILLVAMECGGNTGPDCTFVHAQMKFRDACVNQWNPHMGGVSQIVRHLVGENNAELCSRQFALTNAVKCVKPADDRRSRSTRKMAVNCANHLKEEVAFLRPHLVITQGSHPRRTLLEMYAWSLIDEFSGGPRASAAVWVGGGPFVLLTTPHPARQKGWNWRSKEADPLPIFLQKAIGRASELISVDG